MRKILVAALVLTTLTAGALSAQVRSYKATASEPGPNSIVYALPQTAVEVTLIVEKESIRKGPYARFAQKYLGVMAPLSDKDIYKITGARIGYGEEADPSQLYVLENPEKSPLKLYYPSPEGFIAAPAGGTAPAALSYAAAVSSITDGSIETVSHVKSDTSFVKVSVDRRESMERSTEDMAAAAADMIYTIRKRRMELITGEAGENVFGTGLRSALDELDRMEQEYLALFLGKQSRQQIVSEFTVIPEKGKNNTTVCRFSETAGAVPASDLSARPIVLEMIAEKKVQSMPPTAKPAKGGTFFYRIADIADCVLIDGKREIARERIPVYQFGTVVEIPATSLK